MNSQNYQDDVRKNQASEKAPTRVEELKKKLYSSATGKESAVREREFQAHHLDVGKTWEEVDEKQARLQDLREKEEREAKLGLSRENYVHHGSTLYGHYSPAEEVTHKKINTSFETPLKVVEIPDGVDWEIEEYDGEEWVSEKHRVWY